MVFFQERWKIPNFDIVNQLPHWLWTLFIWNYKNKCYGISIFHIMQSSEIENVERQNVLQHTL